ERQAVTRLPREPCDGEHLVGTHPGLDAIDVDDRIHHGSPWLACDCDECFTRSRNSHEDAPAAAWRARNNGFYHGLWGASSAGLAPDPQARRAVAGRHDGVLERRVAPLPEPHRGVGQGAEAAAAEGTRDVGVAERADLHQPDAAAACLGPAAIAERRVGL